MVFQELDKWMLDIEEKKNPTPRERRQHMKLERVRNETYAQYQKQPIKDGWCKAPMACRERAMPFMMRKELIIGEEFKKTFGGVSNG